MNLGHHLLFHLFHFGTPFNNGQKVISNPFHTGSRTISFCLSLICQCLQIFVGEAISIFVAETPLFLPSIALVCIKLITGSGHVGGNINVAF